jgi:hypothetical protein
MRTPSIPFLALIALLGLGCAQVTQFRSDFAAAREVPPFELEARGPGSVFDSVDAVAVDALTYCHLEAREAGTTERMYAGTIERSGAGFTYSEIHVANALTERRIEYVFSPQDVARFHVYPVHTDHDINRTSERLSDKDRRSVSVIDPLHRSLYVLHPSMTIRAYRGVDREVVEVASLRDPSREWAWPSSFANR